MRYGPLRMLVCQVGRLLTRWYLDGRPRTFLEGRAFQQFSAPVKGTRSSDLHLSQCCNFCSMHTYFSSWPGKIQATPQENLRNPAGLDPSVWKSGHSQLPGDLAWSQSELSCLSEVCPLQRCISRISQFRYSGSQPTWIITPFSPTLSTEIPPQNTDGSLPFRVTQECACCYLIVQNTELILQKHPIMLGWMTTILRKQIWIKCCTSFEFPLVSKPLPQD